MPQRRGGSELADIARLGGEEQGLQVVRSHGHGVGRGCGILGCAATDLSRMHGTDERVAVLDVGDAARFYATFIVNAGG